MDNKKKWQKNLYIFYKKKNTNFKNKKFCLSTFDLLTSETTETSLLVVFTYIWLIIPSVEKKHIFNLYRGVKFIKMPFRNSPK